MNKQTEALKLALEALGHFANDDTVDCHAWDAAYASEAITAIREALAEQPAQRKPLTDEQMFEMAEIAWRHGWASCRDADYVGEEAEDERWGMVGAEVVQDIAAHGIKGNA